MRFHAFFELYLSLFKVINCNEINVGQLKKGYFGAKSIKVVILPIGKAIAMASDELEGVL